uniref:Uncharacterized protein n=1 Tax=uncultured prokaryote TaxID=198431 RepID=A0A0H5Q641_9ZZZZ|nr:hypothetical protein [uncultured prokaryote]
MAIFQYVPTWTGARVGQGATVFHMDSTEAGPETYDELAEAVAAWYSSIRPGMPNDVTVSFPPSMKRIDEVTGNLLGLVSVASPSPVSGNVDTTWANGSGRIVRWATDGIRKNRTVVGHTYIVPSAGFTDPSGNVSSARIAGDIAAHGVLINRLSTNGTPLVVWSRPVKGKPLANPPVLAQNGLASVVTSGTTLGRPVSLRTRND